MAVAWLGDDHIRHGIEEGDVIDPIMCRSIGACEACAVDGEDDGKFLQADVVEEIVESALQECRVDGGDDLHFAAVD